jgi:hypothetical protein
MMATYNRLHRALQIRTASLHLLRTQGILSEVHGLPGRCAAATLGDLEMLHRTPFQQLPDSPASLMYAEALLRQRGGADSSNLVYGLDIWKANRKVFNFEWSVDDRQLKIVGFKRGDWEEALLG